MKAVVLIGRVFGGNGLYKDQVLAE